ncbi:MAG: hypothetical protein LH606_13760 [Cytophagaceae bacterium]|nr:hypothetical protein [Cytophagaceae bacterium]
MNPPIELRRERDFGQKINATFQFAVQNAKPLITCLVYLVVPIALVAGVVGGLYQSKLFSLLGPNPSSGQRTNPMSQIYSQFFSPDYWVLLGLTALSGIMMTLTVCAFLVEYEVAGNRPPAVAQVWQRVRQHLLSGFGLALVSLCLTVIGLFLLFFPGIYISVVLSLSFMVLVQENASLGTALSRPFNLISGKWWSTFGILIVTYFIAAIVGYVFQLPAGILSMLKMFQVLPGDLTIGFIITTMISTVGTVLLQSLVVLAVAFQYYNLVEKKEGVGLLNDIGQIGQAPQRLTTTHDEEENRE